VHDFERGESTKPDPFKCRQYYGESAGSGHAVKLGSCVVEKRELPSVLSVGMAWASRIATLALEFSVPVVIGVVVDRRSGSSPLFTIAGAGLGFLLFMFHTLRMARELAAADRSMKTNSSRLDQQE
jgi:ATP synthase protein I